MNASIAMMLTSLLLSRAGFRHGFFTRQGGVSGGPFASLNFTTSTGDSQANVDENLRRAEAALGLGGGKLFVMSQVHGIACREVTAADDRAVVAREEGDAVLSVDGAVACGVRVADCVPVLVADRRSGAVCAIHSGWVGTERDVVGAGVTRLLERCGGEAELIAAVGPHISVAAFEVDEDVAARLERVSPVVGVVVRAPGAKPHVDLAKIVEGQLRHRGVVEIDRVAGCTVGEPDRFYSFRRDGQRSGRHVAAIVPRPDAL